MLFGNFFNKNKIEKPVVENEPEVVKVPEVVSSNVEDLGDGDPDFVGFGKGSVADLKDKIRAFTINNNESIREKRIKEIKDSIK